MDLEKLTKLDFSGCLIEEQKTFCVNPLTLKRIFQYNHLDDC